MPRLIGQLTIDWKDGSRKPHVVAQCRRCKKYLCAHFTVGIGWVDQIISMEEATALVLAGVPRRNGFCNDCSGYPDLDLREGDD